MPAASVHLAGVVGASIKIRTILRRPEACAGIVAGIPERAGGAVVTGLPDPARKRTALAELASFDRAIDPASLDLVPLQITFDGGLTASSAVVDGRTLRVTTDTQKPNFAYTVTVDESVTDVLGAGVDTSDSTSTFRGLVAAAHLVISEFDHDQDARLSVGLTVARAIELGADRQERGTVSGHPSIQQSAVLGDGERFWLRSFSVGKRAYRLVVRNPEQEDRALAFLDSFAIVEPSANAAPEPARAPVVVKPPCPGRRRRRPRRWLRDFHSRQGARIAVHTCVGPGDPVLRGTRKPARSRAYCETTSMIHRPLRRRPPPSAALPPSPAPRHHDLRRPRPRLCAARVHALSRATGGPVLLQGLALRFLRGQTHE